MSDQFPPPYATPEALKPTRKVLRIWVTHVAVVDVPMPDDFDLGGWLNAIRAQGFFFSLDRRTYIRAEDISLAAVLDVASESPKEGKIIPFAIVPPGSTMQ